MRGLIKSFSLFTGFFAVCFMACKPEQPKPDYRGEMRKFVETISRRGKAWKPGFIVVPQNGLALLTTDGTSSGAPETGYIGAIDGVGQEELCYGYDNNDDVATPAEIHQELWGQCAFARDHGLKVLVTDYAFTPQKMDDSYAYNFSDGFISFAADHRELDNVPHYPGNPFHMNFPYQNSFSTARNFLYLISPSYYDSKEQFVTALQQEHFDVYIIDLYYDESHAIDTADINRIRQNNPYCKILCYMSIGEAEKYRYYWKPYWNAAPPSFLVSEDPYWPDNFNVRYWDPNWQAIICGGNGSYLKKITDAGFDGVYLDLVSEYEFFEE